MGWMGGEWAVIGSGELSQYALLPLRGCQRFGDDVIMGSSGDRMGQSYVDSLDFHVASSNKSSTQQVSFDGLGVSIIC